MQRSLERTGAVRPRRPSLKARQYSDAHAAPRRRAAAVARPTSQPRLRPPGPGRSKDSKHALEAVDELKNERAFDQFREYHAGLIADAFSKCTEAEKRFKAAYAAARNTLQVVDAYARFLAKRGARTRP